MHQNLHQEMITVLTAETKLIHPRNHLHNISLHQAVAPEWVRILICPVTICRICLSTLWATQITFNVIRAMALACHHSLAWHQTAITNHKPLAIGESVTIARRIIQLAYTLHGTDCLPTGYDSLFMMGCVSF